jgi:seryl-tRNA synthetase
MPAANMCCAACSMPSTDNEVGEVIQTIENISSEIEHVMTRLGKAGSSEERHHLLQELAGLHQELAGLQRAKDQAKDQAQARQLQAATLKVQQAEAELVESKSGECIVIPGPPPARSWQPGIS